MADSSAQERLTSRRDSYCAQKLLVYPHSYSLRLLISEMGDIYMLHDISLNLRQSQSRVKPNHVGVFICSSFNVIILCSSDKTAA